MQRVTAHERTLVIVMKDTVVPRESEIHWAEHSPCSQSVGVTRHRVISAEEKMTTRSKFKEMVSVRGGDDRSGWETDGSGENDLE